VLSAIIGCGQDVSMTMPTWLAQQAVAFATILKGRAVTRMNTTSPTTSRFVSSVALIPSKSCGKTVDGVLDADDMQVVFSLLWWPFIVIGFSLLFGLPRQLAIED